MKRMMTSSLLGAAAAVALWCAAVSGQALSPAAPSETAAGENAGRPALIPAAGGVLDTTFDGDGKATTDINQGGNEIYDVALLPDGKILAAGFAPVAVGSSDRAFAVARYLANGALDAAFGTNGVALINISTAAGANGDEARGMGVQADGKIVLTGFSATRANRAVVRLNANGALDTTFGTGGIFTTPIGTPTLDSGDVLLQTDGKIIVIGSERVTPPGGTPTDAFSVMRLNANGTLDASFDTDGKVQTQFILSDRATQAELLPDGKILVGGNSNNNSLFALARYNANGSLDTSFDFDGKVTTAFPSTVAGLALEVQPDGKYLLAGVTIAQPQDAAVARYLPSGALDPTFDGDGRATFDYSGAADSNDAATNIIFRDGKITLTGWTQPNGNNNVAFAVARLRLDGSLDASFGTNGKVVTDIDAGFDTARASVFQADGKLIVAGYATLPAPAARDFALVRYNAERRSLFDFDGDGRSDPGVFRASDRTWYLANSTAGFAAVQWGAADDRLAPADYDGDGKTDIAVWRESNRNFYILNSSDGTVRVENFGLPGDVPTVADWDGDGRADLSTWRAGAQSTFFYRGSSNNPNRDITYLPWGTAGDKPVGGDFDGDGREDAVVFRPAEALWYLRQSSNGQIVYQSWGAATDKIVAADYDGDAKTDLAVYRGGLWLIRQSSDNQPLYLAFGLPNDRPVSADYDGDGRADAAVFRDGIWYVRQSASAFSATPFGLASDQPVTAAFLP